jgi:hypothetical protein
VSLAGCSSPVVKTEYVKPTIPELPAEPDYYEIIWQKIGDLYCVDGQNAKNLLKNRILDKDFVQQHQEIIEGLR